MNSTFQLVLNVLSTLAAIVVNPAVGLSATGMQIAKVLSLVIALGQEGQKANAALKALDDQIKALDAAGGPIPDSVWQEWDDRHEAAKARLANA